MRELVDENSDLVGDSGTGVTRRAGPTLGRWAAQGMTSTRRTATVLEVLDDEAGSDSLVGVDVGPESLVDGEEGA